MRRPPMPCLLPFVLTVGLHAQHFTTGSCNNFNASGNGSGSGSWFSHNERACELRSTLLPAGNVVNVRDTNGGIEVVGEDRRDIALEARVEANAENHDAANALLHQIEIATNGEIHAEGPRNTGFFHSQGWSVSYKLRVPRHLAAQLNSTNGPVTVSAVGGGVDASTVNGPIHLSDLGGDVNAHTVNGPIAIALAGGRWRGNGLVAKTVNGGISIEAPGNLSAHLLAQTVNGGISIGYPMTVAETNHHHVDTNIGSGGPTIDLQTVNGGIVLSRGGNDTRDQREE